MNLAIRLAVAVVAALGCIVCAAADPVVANAALAQLTLRHAGVLFLEHNRELVIAQRAVEGALAESISAGQLPKPTLSVGVAQLPLNGSGIGAGNLTDKRLDTVIGVSQLFERGGKRELRVGAAQEGIEASRKDLQDVLRQQRVALAGAYFDLLLAQHKETISAESAGLFGKTLEAADLRLKAGDIAPNDVARIRVDALRSQNDARSARAEREKAQHALAYLIGAERYARDISSVDPWPDAQAQAEAPPIEQVLEQRADVAGAVARVRAAEKMRELSRSLRTRDITAGVQDEHFPTDGANNTLGISVSIPLFTNYYFQGEIRRAEVALQAAQDNLERVRALALGEIARSRADLEAAVERVRRFQDVLLKESQRAADAAEFAYNKGAIGVLDLLDARRTLRATRIEAIMAQADYAKSLAAWQAAITPADAAPSP